MAPRGVQQIVVVEAPEEVALVESDNLYTGDSGPVVEFCSCETPETGEQSVLRSFTSSREGGRVLSQECDDTSFTEDGETSGVELFVHHLIGVKYRTRPWVIGKLSLRERGCSKSPENMAGNSAGVDFQEKSAALRKSVRLNESVRGCLAPEAANSGEPRERLTRQRENMVKRTRVHGGCLRSCPAKKVVVSCEKLRGGANIL